MRFALSAVLVASIFLASCSAIGAAKKLAAASIGASGGPTVNANANIGKSASQGLTSEIKSAEFKLDKSTAETIRQSSAETSIEAGNVHTLIINESAAVPVWFWAVAMVAVTVSILILFRGRRAFAGIPFLQSKVRKNNV